MTTAYVQEWLIALLITQLVEVPVYLALTRIGVWRALALSLVTHPIVWFVIVPLLPAWGIVIAELFAWLAEAAMLRAFGERWRVALLASLAANATSILVGELARYHLGL